MSGLERVEAAIGGEEEQRVGGLGAHGALQPVALLEGEAVEFGEMALDGADPALLGEHDSDRLLLDQGLGQVLRHAFRRHFEARAAVAKLGLLAEAVFQRFDLVGDLLPLLVLGGEQRLQLFPLLGQGVVLAPDLHLLELAQGAEPHIEDRLGLHLGELGKPSSRQASAHPSRG